MGERNDLIERLRKRAEDEREIQRNNEAVAEALSGQLEAFRRRDGSHNNFAVRLGLDHRSCAKKDASLAADWEEAATTIACLSEALAEAEKKGAEAREVCEERDEDIAVLLDAIETLERSGTLLPGREAGRVAGIKAFLTLRRGQPAPPRDLSQGGQHG